MKKQGILIATAAAVMTIGVIGATSFYSSCEIANPLTLRAEDKTILLSGADTPDSIVSTSEMASASEVSIVSGNSYVTWDYYNVKKSVTGHVVLSISAGVWAQSATGYVQNHQPITGLTQIDISFASAGQVRIYGSNVQDGEYVFLDVLTGATEETKSTVRIADYQFIKIANGSLENDVDIKSIEYHYSCDQNNDLEKNDRMVRAKGLSKNAGYPCSTSTDHHIPDISTESFAIDNTISDSKFYLTLGFDIPKAELSQYKVVYYANAEGVSGFSSSHAYTRPAFKICYEQNGSFTEGTSYWTYKPANIDAGSNWTKYEYSFEDMLDKDIDANMSLASGVVNALRVGFDYTPESGVLYFDQLHVERIGGSYVEDNVDIEAIEAADLTSGTLSGYGFDENTSCVTEDLYSPLTSKQCSVFHLLQGYPCLNYSALKADMTGKVLSFDVYATKTKYDESACNAYDQKIVYKFSYGGVIGSKDNNNYYTTESIHLKAANKAYYSVEDLGSDWYRITIDFDAAVASGLTAAAGNWNMGIFTQGAFHDVYLDNMFLSNKA